ncbi:MAG: hypothetical protein SVY10_13515 [Thermodesulfobacteriota bacterium]|nr:hypothetical protein [Thermodesulfobacteriota bacterium]
MRKDSFTIIYMRHMGKVRSFEIKTKKFLTFTILLLCFILASIYFDYQYFHLHHERRFLLNSIQQLESDLEHLNDTIKENEEYKRWSSKVFSNLLDSVEIQEKERVPASGGAPATSGEDESNKTDQQSSKVSIRDFHVKSDRLSPNIIDFKYTLFNNNENHERISGYITTLACTRDMDPPIYRTFPNVRMRNGIPINYREGQYFAIRYQKPVTGRIQILEEKEKFKEIFVFVYSVKGELLLEKSFELDEQ